MSNGFARPAEKLSLYNFIISTHKGLMLYCNLQPLCTYMPSAVTLHRLWVFNVLVDVTDMHYCCAIKMKAAMLNLCKQR